MNEKQPKVGVGKKFNKLTVINETNPYVSPKGHKIKRWLCKCDCGKIVKVITSRLKNNISCGCFQKEKAAIFCKENFYKGIEKQLLDNKLTVSGPLKTSCWLWKGSLHRSGYAAITVGGKHSTAHREAYKLWVGAIPKDKEVCHLCHIKHCYNPQHLKLGTHKENMEMSVKAGRIGTPKVINAKIAFNVKQLLNKGINNTNIATRLGIPQTVVADIKRGKTWRHV